MPLEKNTDYGKITVSDRVFEDALTKFCQQPSLYEKIWIAPKSNIKASYNEDDRIELSFSAYVKFGQSIKGVSQTLSDKMAKLIFDRSGAYPKVINVNVAGVRSHSLIRRNIDIVIEYDNGPNGRIVAKP